MCSNILRCNFQFKEIPSTLEEQSVLYPSRDGGKNRALLVQRASRLFALCFSCGYKSTTVCSASHALERWDILQMRKVL